MPHLLFLGEVTGLAAFIFVGVSAALMVSRARLVRRFGGTGPLRKVHVAVSILALAFLSIHVSLLFSLPVTIPLDLGYGAVALGVVLWMTGVGFLERKRESFFLHGSLAVAVVALVLVHAASSGTNIPSAAASAVLMITGAVALISAGYNATRMRGSPR